MKKEKTVLRLLPANLHHISAIEHWLWDMAREGLILKKISPWFFTFTRDIPRNWTYRLEPTEHDPFVIPEKQNDLYKEFGWTHVGEIRNFYDVYLSKEEHPAELHTDTVSQALSFSRLCARKKKELFACLGLCVFIIFSSFFFFSYSVLDGSLATSPFLLVILPFAGGYTLWEYLCVKKLKNRLEAGIPLPKDEDYKSLKRGKRITRVLYILLAFSPMFMPTWDLYRIYTAPDAVAFSEIAMPLPFLSLDEIEDAQSFTLTDSGVSAKSGTLLAPRQYHMWQSGAFKGSMTNYGHNSSYLSVDYYQLASPPLLQPTLGDLAKKRDAMPIENDFFEAAYFSQADNVSRLLLGKNQVILEIRYHGEQDLLQSLEAFSTIIETTYDFSQIPT